MSRPLTLTTSDGLSLEADLAPAARRARAGMVLCHPHPLHGGSMRSIVIGALFESLPPLGITCLRFNFRGVGASEGDHDHGDRERIDAEAALTTLDGELGGARPLVLAGWSFGADVALSVRAPAITGWMAIAPPLRYVHDPEGLATDPRPKLVALAQHDEVRSAREVGELVQAWAATEVQVVAGASHFFMGRTDRLVQLAVGYVDELAGQAGDETGERP
jgi:uncharacterized protein